MRTTASLPRRRAAVPTPDHAGYTEAVRRAAALIRGNALQKVVLARELAVEFDTAICLDAVFNRLVTLNPGVTHFQIPLNQGGTLLGASPELLLRREGRRVMCNPLAGSARRVADPVKDAAIGAALLGSPKDRHEHSFVVAQIKEALAPVCDSLHVPPEPSLVQTAQMWHLGTHIEGILTDTGLSALDLALLLHPTPAVCGTPTQEARALIGELEPFDRGTFAGAVGWCDDKGDGEWAVTIRCGIVEDRKIRLYAGAGIVGDSDPEMEWAETEAKLGTMLTVLGLADQHP
ncbi:isochorismate synthase MenF [Asaia lannensis]|uniref:isochorismate synthase n=2 Tax=Asaia TaxID=91914 RepID=A0ABT1CKA1_9PROT|nr:isochorismate synthase [Asaia lannensis]MCO6161011.1 isochorismate synthase [Asaia lannensis NBRC 102526]GBQ95553.1 isochorismate synthase [Asaia lannensis NBRC 102526]